MYAVPKGRQRRAVLKALQRPTKHITTSESDSVKELRFCEHHLKPEMLRKLDSAGFEFSGKHFYKPHEDPVVCGLKGERNSAGDAYAGLHNLDAEGEESEPQDLRAELVRVRAKLVTANQQVGYWKGVAQKVPAAGPAAVRLLSWEWLMAGGERRPKLWAFSSKEELLKGVELAEACLATEMYDALVLPDYHGNPRLMDFRDAYALACIRLKRLRPWSILSDLTGIHETPLAKYFHAAVDIISVIARATTMRPEDESYVKANRTPMLDSPSEFGPKGIYGPAQYQLDGFKIRVKRRHTCHDFPAFD